MSIHVRVSSSLRRHIPDYKPKSGIYADGAGVTAASLALALGMPLREVKFITLNGRLAPMQTFLETGDAVVYFPAVGGG